MPEIFSFTTLLGILYSGVRLATPYLYASIGETFAQRSGVLNLGVDGMMLMGACTGFYAAIYSGSLWVGVFVAMLVGALMGLLMAFISVTLQGTQGISGIGLYMFGQGLSALYFAMNPMGVQSISGFQPIKIPLLGDIPLFGEALFNHNLLVYLAFLLVPVANYVLNNTTFGLSVRAVGQNPQAADSLGVSVVKVRYATVIIGGALSGLAGASLSIALINLFQENMTAGMGFIAVALVYFGGWRPYGVLFGALIFSFVNALQMWIQITKLPIPADLAVMMPYILTLVTLAISSNRTRKPAALTRPYERSEN